MGEYNRKSYYALVWKNTLAEEIYIEGKVIGSNTRLPTDPRMLYGTNVNDVMKIRNVNFKTELSYDVLTTKQSVRYIPIIEEFNIQRDVRIIVWEGSETLHIPHERYRILTPEAFYELVKGSNDYGESEWKGLSREIDDVESGWKACSDPESKMSDSILGMLLLESYPEV